MRHSLDFARVSDQNAFTFTLPPVSLSSLSMNATSIWPKKFVDGLFVEYVIVTGCCSGADAVEEDEGEDGEAEDVAAGDWDGDVEDAGDVVPEDVADVDGGD